MVWSVQFAIDYSSLTVSSKTRGKETLECIFFSCLIVMARTFSTMLNRNSKRGHPCLVRGHEEVAGAPGHHTVH